MENGDAREERIGIHIKDADMHRAEAVHGANGARMIRTFTVADVIYVDARDCGHLRTQVVWALRFVCFWYEVALGIMNVLAYKPPIGVQLE